MCKYHNSDGCCILNNKVCYWLTYTDCINYLTHKREQGMTCSTCEFGFEGLCNDVDGDYEEVDMDFSCEGWLSKEKIDRLRALVRREKNE